MADRRGTEAPSTSGAAPAATAEAMSSDGPAGMTLTDPRQMRALAHPTRLRLIGLLRSDGPMTATQAGCRLGESSGTMSFHLRQLAKYGMVEETGLGTGRQKPWRATAAFTSWAAAPAAPELADATQHLGRVLAARYGEIAQQWVERQPAETTEWREAAQFGDSLMYLTAPELHSLGEQLAALLKPYGNRAHDHAQRPAGCRLVTWLHLVFPAEA